MLFRLAWGNVRRSARDFSVYFMTLAFAACLLYSFLASTDYLLRARPDRRAAHVLREIQRGAHGLRGVHRRDLRVSRRLRERLSREAAQARVRPLRAAGMGPARVSVVLAAESGMVGGGLACLRYRARVRAVAAVRPRGGLRVRCAVEAGVHVFACLCCRECRRVRGHHGRRGDSGGSQCGAPTARGAHGVPASARGAAPGGAGRAGRAEPAGPGAARGGLGRLPARPRLFSSCSSSRAGLWRWADVLRIPRAGRAHPRAPARQAGALLSRPRAVHGAPGRGPHREAAARRLPRRACCSLRACA